MKNPPIDVQAAIREMPKATREERADWLRHVVSDVIPCDVDEVSPNSTLGDLGADSLDVYEIRTVIEEEFGLEEDDSEWLSSWTVSEWGKRMEKLIARKAGR